MITLDTNLSAQNATTQYLGFDYNSMVKVGDKFLCASDVGLFESGGYADVGSGRESYFEPVTMDFGISADKRLRAIYIGYEADGALSLTISTEIGLSETYTIPAMVPGQHARKVNVNRSLHGRYWTFQIYGQGVSFSVDEIKALPIIRGHGFNGN